MKVLCPVFILPRSKGKPATFTFSIDGDLLRLVKLSQREDIEQAKFKGDKEGVYDCRLIVELRAIALKTTPSEHKKREYLYA